MPTKIDLSIFFENLYLGIFITLIGIIYGIKTLEKKHENIDYTDWRLLLNSWMMVILFIILGVSIMFRALN